MYSSTILLCKKYKILTVCFCWMRSRKYNSILFILLSSISQAHIGDISLYNSQVFMKHKSYIFFYCPSINLNVLFVVVWKVVKGKQNSLMSINSRYNNGIASLLLIYFAHNPQPAMKDSSHLISFRI